MNGFEVIQENMQGFICEKKQIKEQIARIEKTRTQLAEARNIIKKYCPNCIEVSEFGKQISELGNQSQELQNKLDSKFLEVKTQINLMVDNLVAEGIRKIRIINGEIQQLKNKIEEQQARKEKYQLQKEEFYLRFGRMPELSERAIKENQLQEKEATKSALEISQMKKQIAQTEEEMVEFVNVKRDFKDGNWANVIKALTPEEVFEGELQIGEIEPMEELIVEAFEPIEELYVEEFEPIEEIYIEEFDEKKTFAEVKKAEEYIIPEIEELAKAIVEEIVEEQTKDINVSAIVENIVEEEAEEDIIVFEKEDDEESEQKRRVTIPLFGQKPTISNIIVKFEEGQLVYKAKMSDNEEIIIYPAKLGEESVLLRDKQNREECKEILINYAISEYKIFDKKVINKIDPLICELLVECAQRYGYNAQELMYDYAMSFETVEGIVPGIIYNLSYIGESNLSKKEKTIINRICKYAKKVNGIDVIESFSGFRKFKYILKRIFAVNNVNVLPEAKY